jgi:hypothetical protein
VLEIGQQLTRRSGDGPAAIRVVGVLEGRPNKYTVQPLPFGSTISFTPEELALLYAAQDSEISLPSEEEMWLKMSSTVYHEANEDARQAERDKADLPSPTEYFAEQDRVRLAAEAAAEAAAKSKHGRGRPSV